MEGPPSTPGSVAASRTSMTEGSDIGSMYNVQVNPDNLSPAELEQIALEN